MSDTTTQRRKTTCPKVSSLFWAFFGVFAFTSVAASDKASDNKAPVDMAIVDDCVLGQFVFSPDGIAVCVTGHDFTTARLYVAPYPPDKLQDYQEVAELPNATCGISAVAWSHSGDAAIAFIVQQVKSRQFPRITQRDEYDEAITHAKLTREDQSFFLYTVNADGTALRQICELPGGPIDGKGKNGDLVAIAWLDSVTLCVYMEGRIQKVDPATRNATVIYEEASGTRVRNLFVLPEARIATLEYAPASKEPQLVVLDAQGGVLARRGLPCSRHGLSDRILYGGGSAFVDICDIDGNLASAIKVRQADQPRRIAILPDMFEDWSLRPIALRPNEREIVCSAFRRSETANPADLPQRGRAIARLGIDTEGSSVRDPLRLDELRSTYLLTKLVRIPVQFEDVTPPPTRDASATGAGLASAVPPRHPATKDPLIANGSFETWKDSSTPAEWAIEIGATNGADKPLSFIGKGEPSGLVLRGDDATRAWHAVQQSFPLFSGSYYRLTFEARATDLKREPWQFDNCYVGVTMMDGDGTILSRRACQVSSETWHDESAVFRAPEAAVTGQAVVFLSKSGTLAVRNLQVEQLEASKSFQILVEDMDRHYSHFGIKDVNWKELVERFREKAEQASDTEEFVDVVAEMLAELKDLHVRIQSPGGGQVATYASSYKSNGDYYGFIHKLKDLRRIGRIGFVGRTDGAYGFISVTSLSGAFTDDVTLDKLLVPIEELFDAPGIILDLRWNQGGSEPLAQRIAGIFADKPRVYARSKVRSGPNHDDFAESPKRVLQPRQGETYTRPIVCLIGPGCVSSGEALAQMMKALPHVTLIGQPTRGASGNPASVDLPNGISVSYSRWVDMLPDGTPIEGKGVPPDITVEHESPGDPTFDAAVTILDEKIGQSLKAEEAK